MNRATLVSAALLVLAAIVPACAANTWDVTWDGYNKPEDSAYNWDTGKVIPAPPNNTQVIVGAPGNARPNPLDGETRFYDPTPGSTRTFYRYLIDPTYTGGVTLEVKMDPRAAALNRQVCLRISSSRGVVQIAWWFGQVLVVTGSPAGLATTVTTNAYHVYRLTEDASGWKLYVDGVFKKSGTVSAHSALPDAVVGEISFGEEDGSPPSKQCDIYYDYVYIDTGGAYAPGDVDDPLGSAAAPYITKGPVATSTIPDQFSVTWETSIPADSTVFYRQLGTPTWQSTTLAESVTSHSVTVGGLVGGGPYEYYVASSDGTNTVASDVKQVTPIAQVKILYGQAFGPKVTSNGDGTYQIDWRATYESDSYLYYRQVGAGTWNELYDPTMIPRFDPGSQATTTHVMTLSGLTPNATYEWYVRSTHPVWGEDQTVPATLEHVFTIRDGPYASPNAGNCHIQWQTNLAGSHKVYYRILGGATWATVTNPDPDSQYHGVDLTGLLVPAAYEYKVESTTSVAGFGTVTSAVHTFETYQMPGGNLLVNPSFEDADMSAWHTFAGPWDHAVNLYRAEGTGAPGFHSDQLAHSGTYRLQGGVDGRQSTGGVYQVIPGSSITDTTLYASAYVVTHEILAQDRQAYGYTWTEYDEAHVVGWFRIGIDPTGGIDYSSANVVWSAPVHSFQKGRPYVPVSISAPVTPGTDATVFIKCVDGQAGYRTQMPVFVDDVWAGHSPGLAAPGPSDITVVENDPLSITVSWSTPIPTTSMVQYTWDGSPALSPNGWFAYDDQLVTNHSVTITNRFLPDMPQKFRVQSVSSSAWVVSDLRSFQTGPLDTLRNGDFEASGLAWDQELGFGMGAIPWVKFMASGTTSYGTGISRDETYPMHGFLSSSPTHSLIFEEGYSTAMSYGGAYQRIKVGTANAGEMYTATSKVFTYAQSQAPSDVNNRLGIDPTGGTDPDGVSVVWGPWVNTGGAWGQAVCAAIAGQGADPWDGYITVFLQTEHRWAVPLNLTMFDDVQLTLAVPKTSIKDAKNTTIGWPVDLGATGPGILVTKSETLTENNPEGATGPIDVPYCWVQDDDRANGIRVRLDKLDWPTVYELERGARVRIRGVTNRRELQDNYAGELEIVALQAQAISTGNEDPVPLEVTNKTAGGAASGNQRGATGAAGAGNIGLIVKTTGKVLEVQDPIAGFPFAYYFVIDDGSAVFNPLAPGQIGLMVYQPYDEYYWRDPVANPFVGETVAVTGTSCLEVYDPTPIVGTTIPDGSGDEVLVPIIRMRDGRDLQILQP